VNNGEWLIKKKVLLSSSTFHASRFKITTMSFTPALRIANLGGYAFAEVDKKAAELRDAGITPIDFGVGDPVNPTPAFIREATRKALDQRATSGYPSYIGSEEFRRAVAKWMQNRFGVELNPATEITSSIGSKEAIFHFPLAFINPGDEVLIPSPGYPPYARGTQFAGGKSIYYPLLEENNFLPDFNYLKKVVTEKTKILWINYPNSPTGKLASDEVFKQAINFGKKYNIIIASDAAYSEIYFEKKPRSILEFIKTGVVEFHSLSKRSAMTGYRVGWVAGDAKIIDLFKKVKTNIDSGTPTFLQDAAITALTDEKHIKAMRMEYKEKRNILVSALEKFGLSKCLPEATFYIWQKVPKGISSVEFATKLLDPKIAVVVTPGEWISETIEGVNPGANFVRFALVPTVEQVKEAAEKIIKNLKI